MSRHLTGAEVAARVRESLPQAVAEEALDWVRIIPEQLPAVARLLRDDPTLDCAYLTSVTAVDWLDHFEMVYHLASLRHNHVLVLKVRLDDHENPEVASLTPIWKGADLQEREVYDLMGIRFTGHPDLRRVFLWEGFAGHPLRKDYLNLPGGFKPGLPRFPGVRPEEGEGG